jgi:hypothetical protein
MRIGPWREELGSPEITYNGQAGGDAAHILGHEERLYLNTEENGNPAPSLSTLHPRNLLHNVHIYVIISST